jgi:hypothetical protein
MDRCTDLELLPSIIEQEPILFYSTIEKSNFDKNKMNEIMYPIRELSELAKYSSDIRSRRLSF